MPRAGRAEIVPCSNASPTASPREASGENVTSVEKASTSANRAAGRRCRRCPDRGTDGHGRCQESQGGPNVPPAERDHHEHAADQRRYAEEHDRLPRHGLDRADALVATLSFDDEPGEQGRRRDHGASSTSPHPAGFRFSRSIVDPIDASLERASYHGHRAERHRTRPGQRDERGTTRARTPSVIRAPTKHATPISKPGAVGRAVVHHPRRRGPKPRDHRRSRGCSPGRDPDAGGRPPLLDECASVDGHRLTPPSGSPDRRGRAS